MYLYFSQDNIPELSEVFVVELLSAHLVSDPSVTVALGPNTTVQVTITANDNPSGIFMFQVNS